MPTRYSRPAALAAAASTALFAGLAFTLPATSARAQDAAPQPADQGPANAQLLEDFVHWVKVANFDVAAATARQLLDRNISNRDFVALVEAQRDLQRFQNAIGTALKNQKTEALAAQVSKKYETGKLERARDPEEVRQNIEALTGTLRGKLLARDRLIVAGEYAVPQLLAAFLDGANPARQAEVRGVLRDLGRQAVIPLSTALPRLTAAQQEQVIDVLGTIPYRTSLPFIVDVRLATTSEAVRAASDRATARLSGQAGGDAESVASMYVALAEGYYGEKSDLTSFPNEEFQLLWAFTPQAGLSMQGIRTEVFHEAMAMLLSKRAMELGDPDRAALALWIAANFSREIDTPEGYQNPAYAAGAGGMREGMYYAVAAPASVSERVLGRALDDRDTPLARRALAAVEKTAGGVNLWAGADRRPLLEALTYPNRRVQYEAALAIAAAQPKQAFGGSDRVVPVLAGAIREASTLHALVLAPDNERYQTIRGMLEKLNYQVLPFARTVAENEGPLADVPAVDLVVSVNMTDSPAIVESVRGTPKLSATPVLVMTPSADAIDLARRWDRDSTIAVRPMGITEQAFGNTVTALIETASGGPITGPEALQYASRALGALRDLAVAGNPVLDVSEAARPLIAALSAAEGEQKFQVAEVLSRIGQARAQVAVMDAAMGSSGADQVALLGKVADSAKRFGNLLEERQVKRLLELAGSSDDAVATAAAALMGALNLPNDQLVPLILKAQG